MVDREEVLHCHKKAQGKTEIMPRVLVEKESDLSTYYTPGVSFVSEEIGKNSGSVYDYTTKSNTIAIISDCTRVLGLGNVGPLAGLPVMEGKAVLFKKFGGVDAVPICINTVSEEEIIALVKHISPTFGGINIEDIESPKSLSISQRLSLDLDIPVFHDDRQGTAVVVLAALVNALKLVGKGKKSKIIINGAGSAGFGIAMQLVNSGFKNIIVFDKGGAIYSGRDLGMNPFKKEISEATNKAGYRGSIDEAANGADVLIGASSKGAFSKDMISNMATKPIVFALANPYPEIGYEEAKDAGAFVVATGSSDQPNQVNNLLAFPAIMRGLLDSRATKVTYKMLHNAAMSMARGVGSRLSVEHIIPNPLENGFATRIIPKIAASVAESAVLEGLARYNISYDDAKMRAAQMIERYRRMERSSRRYLVGTHG